MKAKDKILLLSMLALGITGCSKKETGIVSEKHGTYFSVKLVKDTTDTRTIDWWHVRDAAQNTRGMFGGVRVSSMHVFQFIEVGDTITYSNNKGQDIIVMWDINQLKTVNGMKPFDFLNHAR